MEVVNLKEQIETKRTQIDNISSKIENILSNVPEPAQGGRPSATHQQKPLKAAKTYSGAKRGRKPGSKVSEETKKKISEAAKLRWQRVHKEREPQAA